MLRNLPTDKAVELADLVQYHPAQVSSKSFTTFGSTSLTLFAFAAGESVSEEEYAGDTLYLCLDGTAVITLPGKAVELATGEAIGVPRGVQHAIQGASPSAGFKLLQLTVE